MERRVKFEANVQEKPGKDQARGGNGLRKAATSIGESGGTKGPKPPIPFEEFLRRKSNKPAVPTKGKPEPKVARKPATAGDRPSEVPPKKVGGILRDKSPKNRGNAFPDADDQPSRPDNLQPPRERSLENIFLAEQDTDTFKEPFRPSIPRKEEEILRPRDEKHQKFDIGSSMPPMQQLQNNQNAGINVSSILKEDATPAGKAIRGYFKKEVYGEDAHKREVQARMKRELEEQMEANKARKEAEEARKKAEEAREAEQHARYLEKQRDKQLEEERREQEKKRNREVFAQQQVAVLGEFQNQVTQEKRSKRNKPGLDEDQLSQPQPARYAVSTASTQQAVSPPTVPYQELPRPGNTPSSLQTTTSPIDKDLVDNLLKENQGLKEAANRNNIILDFLTDVLVKKQQLQTSGSVAGTNIPASGSILGRDDYQTVDGTIQSHTGMAQAPQKGKNPNKPFRINTPLTNPQGSFNLGRAAWRPQLNSGPSEYRSPGAQEQGYQGNWGPQPQMYNQVPPRKLKSSSPTQVNPFPVGFAKPNTGSYTRPEYYNSNQVETMQIVSMGGQKASSLMEEFQDLDNFKMISDEDPQATYFGYERADDGQFEEDLNLDHRGIRNAAPQDRGDYHQSQRHNEHRSKGLDQRRPPQQLYAQPMHSNNGNYRGGGAGYLNSGSNYDYEPPEQQFFPPVNHRTDIKARSEKYKHELASKLTRIKNELNMNDSKIDNLLQKIGAGS